MAPGEPFGIACTLTAKDGTATGRLEAKAAGDPGDWPARRADGPPWLRVSGEAVRPSSAWAKAMKLTDIACAPLRMASMFRTGPVLIGAGVAATARVVAVVLAGITALPS